MQPYLFFSGRTARFKDSPAGLPPGYNQSPDMACDGMQANGKPAFQGFSLTYEASDESDAKRRFDALASTGGQVQMAFGETFFAEAFGVVADKFGVSWMIMAGAKQ